MLSTSLFKTSVLSIKFIIMNEKNLSSPIISETRTGEGCNDLTLLSEVEIKYKPEVKPKDRPRVTMAMEAYKLIRPFFEGCLYHHEEAWVMLLNTSCKVLGVARLSVGNQEHTIIDPRTTLQLMIKTNAVNLIIFHNHPSQSLAFSPEDIKITKNMMETCKLLNMNCLDHIIVGEDGYSSYSEEGY